jgi:Yip1-like protein
MNLVERAKNILLQPNQEWPVIAAEPTDTKSLFIGYAVPLAAIAPIAVWLGHSLIGISMGPLGTYRTPIVAGIGFAVLTYVLALASVFVVGLIIDALAPSFGGEKNSVQAMKCAVYAHTPGWLGGIFHLLPALSILAVVASLYGLYLLYLGLPVLMKAPKDKAVGYAIVVVICAIVLAIVVGVIGGIVGFGGSAMRGSGMFGGAPGSVLGTARPEAAPDSVLGKLDTLSKKMEESSKKMEEANKKGDTAAAMGAAMEGLSTMASGGKKVEPIDADRLKAFLPETLDGMKRADVTTEQNSFGPMSVTMASASYQDAAGRKVRIGVGDMAAAGGLFALTAMMGAGQIKESDAGYEKMHKVDGRLVIEKLDRKSGAAEYGVVLAERFVVNTSSPNVDPPALRAMVAKLDLGKLEGMKDVGVQR